MPDRAILFVDGNNWYHACKNAGIGDLFMLNYVAIAKKLTAPRDWAGLRYYIGALKQEHKGHREQRQFLSKLHNQDPLISVHLGKIEERPKENELASALLQYLTGITLDPAIRSDLMLLAKQHRMVSYLKEKAADVMLAVEMYKLAVEDKYDAAYLLSADGDFAPAVQAVRDLRKKVYCASPGSSYALKNVANAYIFLPKDWFQDCYLTYASPPPTPS